MTLDADSLGLRTLLLADSGGSKNDIAASVERALAVSRSGVVDYWPLLALASVTTGSGLNEQAEQILQMIADNTPVYFLACFRARLRYASGDVDGAHSLYAEAMASSPQIHRVGIGYEYAVSACDAERYSTVTQIVEEVGLRDAPEVVFRVYLTALSALDRWDTIANVLDAAGTEAGVMPNWAVEASAIIALRRYDFAGAVDNLQELRRREAGDSNGD